MQKNQLDKILSAVAQYSRYIFGHKLDSVILYGSYARGDFDEESDIDIMVLVDMGAEELMSHAGDFCRLATDLSLDNENCTLVSLTLKDKATFDKWLHVVPFYQNVAREGVRIGA